MAPPPLPGQAYPNAGYHANPGLPQQQQVNPLLTAEQLAQRNAAILRCVVGQVSYLTWLSNRYHNQQVAELRKQLLERQARSGQSGQAPGTFLDPGALMQQQQILQQQQQLILQQQQYYIQQAQLAQMHPQQQQQHLTLQQQMLMAQYAQHNAVYGPPQPPPPAVGPLYYAKPAIRSPRNNARATRGPPRANKKSKRGHGASDDEDEMTSGSSDYEEPAVASGPRRSNPRRRTPPF
jgi:hypothetical protein